MSICLQPFVESKSTFTSSVCLWGTVNSTGGSRGSYRCQPGDWPYLIICCSS